SFYSSSRVFYISSSCHLRDLHSFPTRRSSDLLYNEAAAALPRFKPATLAEVKRRTAARDFDPGQRFFALHDGQPVGYAVYNANRSEEHTSVLQSPCNLVCRLLLEKKK